MASLEIKNVKKAFGQTEVLKGINLSIEDGEFLILVGPSGCGKSTLMNMIAGLESVTSGEILIGGEDVTHRNPKDRDIAMVFQSYALYPSMNVRENMSFALEMRGVPRAERDAIVLDVAKLLQIDHLLDRKPSQLSGGQRQRVAMGRALARKPKIYLFDEPLSNLDAKLRVDMRTEIKKLHHRLGTTIVYVTHDQIEAMTLADRIAVMKDGQVQQFGTPQQVYDEPENLFVAGFMGSPSMNFIRATVEQHEGAVGVWFSAAGKRWFMPLQRQAAGLASHLGKDVIVGIRPERLTHVQPQEAGREDVVTLEAPVDVVEPTGPDNLVEVTINGTEVTCRVAPDHCVKVGEVQPLMMDLSRVVVFDPQTEARIR
ncbi:ABC transporter ATP-binding protein [Hahella sp. SMD15-11]|uniref:ABC transporter ATP-binding protein n=1 Tax=Thermohahella caldifontis TaxID=3142973 RepID=A0AB39UUT6_9GAMM